MKPIYRILTVFGICALIRLSLICSTGWHGDSKYTEIVAFTPGYIRGLLTQTENTSTYRPSPRDEVRHIFFLKMPKAASSTITNVFLRFGYSRNLSFLMGKRGKVYSDRTVIPGINNTYDILAHHVTEFDYKFAASKMPSDSIYIAVVREPLDRLYSAYKFNMQSNKHDAYYISSIGGDNPFETYCRDPERYEKGCTCSYSDSRIARYFGYSPVYPQEPAKLQTYLSKLADIFQLVLVVEYFYESVVMLRRKLNWTLQDILYTVQKPSVYKGSMNISQEAKASVMRFLQFDYSFYNHFLAKLNIEMENEGVSFKEEVIYFKAINERVNEYCASQTLGSLYIATSEWNEDFYVSKKDCHFLQMTTRNLTTVIRNNQLNRIANA